MPFPTPPAAGKVIGSDGTKFLGVFPPGHLLANDRGATFANSTSETTVLSAGAISGAFPAGIAVGDAVRIVAAGTFTNQSGGNATATFNLYSGATLLATANSGNVGNNATPRAWSLDITCVYDILGGAGVGAIKPCGAILFATSSTAAIAFPISGVVTLATNAAAALDLKAQMSSATSTTMLCNQAQVRYFPKNY